MDSKFNFSDYKDCLPTNQSSDTEVTQSEESEESEEFECNCDTCYHCIDGDSEIGNQCAMGRDMDNGDSCDSFACNELSTSDYETLYEAVIKAGGRLVADHEDVFPYTVQYPGYGIIAEASANSEYTLGEGIYERVCDEPREYPEIVEIINNI